MPGVCEAPHLSDAKTSSICCVPTGPCRKYNPYSLSCLPCRSVFCLVCVSITLMDFQYVNVRISLRGPHPFFFSGEKERHTQRPQLRCPSPHRKKLTRVMPDTPIQTPLLADTPKSRDAVYAGGRRRRPLKRVPSAARPRRVHRFLVAITLALHW